MLLTPIFLPRSNFPGLNGALLIGELWLRISACMLQHIDQSMVGVFGVF